MRLRFTFFAVVLVALCAPTMACGGLPAKPPRTTGVQPTTKSGATRVIQGKTAGPGADLSNMDLSREDLSDLDLTGANFSGSTFNKAYLSRAILVNANFTGADVGGSNMYRANFTGANLTNTSFLGVNGEEANFTGAIIKGTSFSYAHLLRAVFDEGALEKADSSGATMPDGSQG